MKKSQVSIELLFAIGFVIFVFIILLAFTMERRYEVRKTEVTLKEKEECYKLSNFISGVYTLGTGAEVIINLKYDAEIDAEEGSIFVGEGRFFCTFPINSVTNSIGTNFNLSEGIVTLNNTDGTVVIQNA